MIKLNCTIRSKQLVIKEPLQLKDGDYTVIIKRSHKNRSLSQLRYLFGVVYVMIASETGHSVDEIHSAMKMLFLADYLKMKNIELLYTKSLSDEGGVDTSEMTDYIENVRAFAANELGLNIPDPGDYYE